MQQPTIRTPFRAFFAGDAGTDMPYGIVMASGGAGQVAALAGWPVLAALLTAIAILQAVLVPLRSLADRHGAATTGWRFGWFTIALGLAVIAGNLHAWTPVAGQAVLILAWGATLVIGGHGIARTGVAGKRTGPTDGTWFLAPAALLGNAAAMAALSSDHAAGLMWLAAGVCLAGVAGYGYVIAASARRILRHGRVPAPLAPWWIAAGCGGLAAAALGRVAAHVPGVVVDHALNGLAAAVWVVATICLVGVLIGCLRHAWQRSPGPWSHVWTPVFSTAVYAAGTYQVADAGGTGWLHVFAFVCMGATLVLWAANGALCLRGR